jgi:hypothetical protein
MRAAPTTITFNNSGSTGLGAFTTAAIGATTVVVYSITTATGGATLSGTYTASADL